MDEGELHDALELLSERRLVDLIGRLDQVQQAFERLYWQLRLVRKALWRLHEETGGNNGPQEG